MLSGATPKVCHAFQSLHQTCHKLCRRPRWFSWMRVQFVIRMLLILPPRGRQHSFVEIDHEVFSMVILSLLLIQEGQLPFSGKELAQYWLLA